MKLWTSVELAKITELSDRQIRYCIADGKIAAQKKGRSWIILDDEAQTFIELRKEIKQDD